MNSPLCSGSSPSEASAPSPKIAKSNASASRRRSFRQAEHVTKWSNAVWPATQRHKKAAIAQAHALRRARLLADGRGELLPFEPAPSTYTYPLYTPYTYPSCDNVVAADLAADSDEFV